MEVIKRFFKKKQDECSLSSGNMKKLREITTLFQNHSEIVTAIYTSLFDSDDICYIATMDTFELIWANRRAKELFGADIVGKKCYEALQESEAPCVFCTNSRLKKTKEVKWFFHNPVVNKSFLIKDKAIQWNGKEVRFEVAIDISDVKNLKRGPDEPTA